MLQSLNTPPGVCVCACAYDIKTAHSTVGSGVKDTMMKVFICKNSAAVQRAQTIYNAFLLFPILENSLKPVGVELVAYTTVYIHVCRE